MNIQQLAEEANSIQFVQIIACLLKHHNAEAIHLRIGADDVIDCDIQNGGQLLKIEKKASLADPDALATRQRALDAVWATWTQGADLSAAVAMVRPLITKEENAESIRAAKDAD